MSTAPYQWLQMPRTHEGFVSEHKEIQSLALLGLIGGLELMLAHNELAKIRWICYCRYQSLTQKGEPGLKKYEAAEPSYHQEESLLCLRANLILGEGAVLFQFGAYFACMRNEMQLSSTCLLMCLKPD